MVKQELRLLKEMLKRKCPITLPKITLVIVNKRINQRFFEPAEGHNGKTNFFNPPSGTIVDSSIVYSEDQGGSASGSEQEASPKGGMT